MQKNTEILPLVVILTFFISNYYGSGYENQMQQGMWLWQAPLTKV